MNDDAKKDPEVERRPVDWEELRAEAEKLGTTLSELQQRQRLKALKLERKAKTPKRTA